jgi:hypothetical protein
MSIINASPLGRIGRPTQSRMRYELLSKALQTTSGVLDVRHARIAIKILQLNKTAS